MNNNDLEYQKLIERISELEERLAKTQWLYGQGHFDEKEDFIPFYGDVTELNKDRTIMDIVGKESLEVMTSELMDLLDTSVAVYEKNGDYAYGVFNSSWCQFLDSSSRKLCNTDDNKTALSCGKWLCHDDCWNNSAKAAIQSKQATDIDCVGGIKLYGEPIFLGEEVIGVINIGYGNPPTDDKSLKELSEKYHVDFNILKGKANAYKPRPEFIIEAAKKRLKSIAKLIGETIKNKQLAYEIKQVNDKFRGFFENSALGIFRSTPEGKYELVNEAFARILGFDSTQKMLNEITEISKLYKHPEDREKVKKELNDKGFLKDYEILANHPKNNIAWISITAKQQRHDNGDIYYEGTIQDITGNKRAEDNLKESREEIIRILENSMDAILLTGPDGSVYSANPAACNMFGRTEKEICDIGREGLVDNSDPRLAIFLKTRSEQGKFKTELNLLRKDGTIFPAEVSSALFKDKDGNLKSSMIIRDITVRKKAEQELQISEEKFKNIFNNSIVGKSITEMDGSLSVNNAFSQLVGYSEDELNKMKWQDFTHPDDIENNNEITKTIVSGKINSARWEKRYIHKKGDTVWVDISTALQRGDEGQPDYFITSVIDITGYKKVQKELVNAKEKAEESEMQLKYSQKVARIGYYVFDVQSGIWTSSEMLDEIFGIDKNYVRDVNGWTNIIHADFQQDMLNYLSVNIIKNHENFNKSYQIVNRKTNKLIWVHGLGTLELDDDNNVLKMFGTIQDISQTKEFEQEIIKAKEKAEESDRLKSAFLANMSHEIRTPMNGILGFTNLLKEPNLSDDKKNRFIDIVKKSGERMLDTVNDIIDISKIDSGQVEVSKSDININEEIRSNYEFFKAETKAKGIEIKLLNKLPKQSIIVSDRVKFNSIIANLIKNAIKYTDIGRIEIHCNKKDSDFHFSVTDTGIGIPKNRIQSIFNRFEQADIDDIHAREGSGLGLSISEAYVEMLGGSIGVESEEGKGSTFYFTIPWIEKQEKPELIKDKEVIDSASEHHLNILIAEDDDISFEHLHIVVDEYSKRIIRATNGKKVVELLKKNSDIDLVLMDVKMPLMDGYKATKEIRKFNNDVIIIAQTAYALEGEKEKALAAGCNDYISKPINKNVLIELIQKYLKK